MSSKYSYLSNAHPDFIDSQYKSYKEDPESVEYGWQKFFEGFDFAHSTSSDGVQETGNLKEIYVLNLIDGYRTRGHLFTKSNPVRDRRKYAPTLDLENFQLEQSDLDTVFNAGVEVGLGPAKLRDIVDLLQQTYCQSIGAEYRYIRETEIHNWLRDRMEATRNKSEFSMDEKRHILHKLNQAVVFEKFLGQKYVGQKRFSIEGAESMIPALDELIEAGSEGGVEEFVVGMAHRGRLNILVNILNKSYSDVFTEFEEVITDDDDFYGDVKYHHGHSVDIQTEKGKTVHLSLCPNPSHLEAVGPVAIGKARAKIDAKYNRNTNALATLLIHGDASIAGQGVVYETIQMSELDAYQTGGTVHMVINNQVGFTTNYTDARTSTYCTDVAKVTNSPVFHVNGDDAEAVVHACRLAMEFRQKFHRDVFIDLLCYRRHGHNEGDEPRFTQPTLYKIIEKHPNPRDIYFESLKKSGNVEATLAKQMEKEFQKMLQERLNEVKKDAKAVNYSFMTSNWKDLRPDGDGDWNGSPETGVSENILRPLADKMLALPEDKTFYKKMSRIFRQREKMLNETDKLDWSMGELLAYASLLNEGNHVRMSGQDVERGTFGHRHAVLRFEGTEEEYIPLNHVAEEQAQLEIYNSHLSEYAVLGFEYGYSWSAPYHLTIWEAQFGDFVNGAQIIIDQFISSAGQKWRRYSGLVMLLPHGYEGQGPEHSSARMERFLELSSGNNWQIANPTTPAQMFHLLRRQVRREFRVPLIVFTPKSLLRLQAATSSFSELTSGSFQEVLDDPTAKAKDVKRILLCSGKIYYDLLKERDAGEHKEVAIVRMEQIYPLPVNQIAAIKDKYKQATEIFWVQEEPENMGPWPFILRKSRALGLAGLDVIARPESASTATGYKKKHTEEQAEIMARSFAKVGSESKELLTEAQ